MSKSGSGPTTFALTGVAAFMASMDNLVVTTALPRLRADLHASLESLEWTVSAYTLTFAVFLLTAAIVGDRFGRKRIFTTGIAVFTAASALAALSDSAGMLIAARAIQGVGGSVIFPLALTMLVRAVPTRRRGLAIAGLSGMSGLAIALGPLVGGLIVEYGDWHWIFWINVPIGVVLVPLAAVLLRESHGPHSRLDVRGTVLVTLAMVGVGYGLVRASSLGWGNPQVPLSIAAGLVLFAVFGWWERRAAMPVVPPQLFRSRGFTLSNLVSLLAQGGMFGAVFLLTQFLQNVLAYPPMTAGLRTLPWTLMPVITAPLTAMLANRFGVRRLLIVSALVMAAALGAFALVVSTNTPYLELLPAMVLAGVGMGMFFALGARQTLDFVTPEQEGVASGMNNATRQLGVVLGIATLSGVFAANGGYATAATFVRGLEPALWFGTAVLVVAAVVQSLVPVSHQGDAGGSGHREGGLDELQEPAVLVDPERGDRARN
ncbi:DHA2 family efflux MFS transporter permease subunit [Kutzneria buriramensis]|uniref:EmrB/QacA subfamily drug resistance transporter n=1 Tax=Kutzneria buriramensis TaxID=1045776 RepID=A0A3E0HL24_9PSEU|nr:DHA2 family efflux MFS transporter permease subunit [Kutzneria buriramensis]REH47040.1 EmrB/QacA subfamily drug resistance transporter [Kutzneria buriramensis]